MNPKLLEEMTSAEINAFLELAEAMNAGHISRFHEILEARFRPEIQGRILADSRNVLSFLQEYFAVYK